MKISILLILGIVFILLVSGCTQQESSTGSQQNTENLALGSAVTYKGIKFSVFGYELADTYQYANSDYELDVEEGNQFLYLYVNATNVGNEEQYIPFSGDIDLISGSNQYSQEYIVPKDPRGLGQYEGTFNKIYPGISEAGYVLFEIPKDLDVKNTKVIVGFKALDIMSKFKASWKLA